MTGANGRDHISASTFDLLVKNVEMGTAWLDLEPERVEGDVYSG